MLKRRSFLAMLGLAPVAPALSKLSAEPVAAEAVAETGGYVLSKELAEGMVMANVRMPVKIGLTQEQVDLCAELGMDINEYAKNLLALKKEGKIEGDVNLDADINQISAKGI